MGRTPPSVEETEGRRDGGRDGFFRDMAGARGEDAGEKMFGLTSAGDEYDRFSDHPEDDDG